MAHPYLVYVLSRPHGVKPSLWEQFHHDDHLDDLIKHHVAIKGSMYKVTANPMGRDPPDDHTHLVLYETDHEKPFESPGFKNVKKTSPLFPPGTTSRDVSDLECRHYKLLEVFDPQGSCQSDKPAPFVLHAEILVDDIDDFRKYYRDDHVPMMAKHKGYRRATMYSYLGTSLVHGVKPETEPGSIVVVHEWDSFDELGGPATKAALNTEYAVSMHGKIRSIKTRALELVCVDPSQR